LKRDRGSSPRTGEPPSQNTVSFNETAACRTCGTPLRGRNRRGDQAPPPRRSWKRSSSPRASGKGPKDRWEFAVIGKNLNNALTSGNCTNGNYQGGLLPGTEITGTNLRGPAGVDEVGCWMDRGREVWIRLTLKPTN
jgi:hypothetical protein